MLPTEVLLLVSNSCGSDAAILPFVCRRFWHLLRHRRRKLSVAVLLKSEALWEFGKSCLGIAFRDGAIVQKSGVFCDWMERIRPGSEFIARHSKTTLMKTLIREDTPNLDRLLYYATEKDLPDVVSWLIHGLETRATLFLAADAVQHGADRCLKTILDAGSERTDWGPSAERPLTIEREHALSYLIRQAVCYNNPSAVDVLLQSFLFEYEEFVTEEFSPWYALSLTDLETILHMPQLNVQTLGSVLPVIARRHLRYVVDTLLELGKDELLPPVKDVGGPVGGVS